MYIKPLLYIVLASFTSIKSNGSNKVKFCNDIDSSLYYLRKLDSIVERNPFDSSIICKKAINYMECLTGIKASSDGNYFGEMLFGKKDIVLWRKWINANKKRRYR